LATSPLSVSLPARLIALRRVLLLALLAALYVVLWQGPDTLFGRTLFIAHLGLFILWQPFVHTGQRLSLPSLLAVLAAALLLPGIYPQGLDGRALWIMMLAGIVGGKVLLFGARSAGCSTCWRCPSWSCALMLMAAPLAVTDQAKPPGEIVWLRAMLPGGVWW
jgi:hypothetical protein